MYKYHIFSLFCLITAILISGIFPLNFQFLGNPRYILVFLLPLVGAILAFKIKDESKWVFVLLNIIAFLGGIFIFLLFLSMKFGGFAP